MRVELQHPVADDLQRHPADLRRLGPRRAIVNRRQRQKPPSLRPVLRLLRRSPHHARRQNQPEAQSAWRTSFVRHLESDNCRFENPHRVTPGGNWYSIFLCDTDAELTHLLEYFTLIRANRASGVNRRRKVTPDRRPKLTPLVKGRTVALAPAELVGVAQPGRARFGEMQATLVGQARFLKRRLSRAERTSRGSISAEAAGRNDRLEFREVEVADRLQRLGGGAVL